MNLVIEVREVALASPALDFEGFAIGSLVGVIAVAITGMKPPLVLALQLVVE